MEWFAICEHMWFDAPCFTTLCSFAASLSYTRFLWARSRLCSGLKTANHVRSYLTRRRGAKKPHMAILFSTPLSRQSKFELTWSLTNQNCVFTMPAGCKLPKTQACYIQFNVISHNGQGRNKPTWQEYCPQPGTLWFQRDIWFLELSSRAFLSSFYIFISLIKRYVSSKLSLE